LGEAADRTRREFLARARFEITAAIDSGVPAHALARLITEADRIDSEIRRLDSLAKQEEQDLGKATADEGWKAI
jgi:hypothetical protein